MSPTRVAVIGAGMAGPALAIFLKQKGYEPVVFERHGSVTDNGLGIAIQSNGQRVIGKIPGLREAIGGQPPDEWRSYSMIEGDKGLLGKSDYLKQDRERDGYGAVARRRADIQMEIIKFAQKAGVEVKWSHKLVSLQQTDDSVTVTFENGAQETFSFVVGCDGLHSGTRECLFGKQPANYTGLASWGGLSPIPEFLRGTKCWAEIYGDGKSMTILPIAEDTVMWAVTQREDEVRESWRSVNEKAMEDFKNNSPFSKWDFGGGEAVRTSSRMTRYGLYDRKELECWHKGRVTLLGDAAHPTTPHVGQGTNQALIDIDTFVSLLELHNPLAKPPSTATLEVVFKELEQARLPRTAAIVKQARVLGDKKVIAGRDACLARNAWCRKIYEEKLLDERFPM